jgi:hypothetical protein
VRFNSNPFNLRCASSAKSVVRQLHTIERSNRAEALEEVERALARGNAVKMINSAGKYSVTELVMQ